MEEIESNAGPHVEKLLVGNKCDLASKRVVSFDQGKGFADSIGVQFIETSALNSTNVDEAFMALARSIKNKGVAGVQRPNVLKQSPSEGGGGCC